MISSIGTSTSSGGRGWRATLMACSCGMGLLGRAYACAARLVNDARVAPRVLPEPTSYDHRSSRFFWPLFELAVDYISGICYVSHILAHLRGRLQRRAEETRAPGRQAMTARPADFQDNFPIFSC